MTPLARGLNAFNAHRNSRTILAIRGAVAVSQLYLTSAIARLWMGSAQTPGTLITTSPRGTGTWRRVE
jgi:hypothetical protein